MAKWFGALDLRSGGPWFKSFIPLLSGFVCGIPVVVLSNATDHPSISWDSKQSGSLSFAMFGNLSVSVFPVSTQS